MLIDTDLVDERYKRSGPLNGDSYCGVDAASDDCVYQRDKNWKTPQNIRILKQ